MSFHKHQTYYQRNCIIPLEQIEQLVSEFNDDEQRYVEILAERVLVNAKRLGAPNFGPTQAREIVLRLIVKTEGAILDF